MQPALSTPQRVIVVDRLLGLQIARLHVFPSSMRFDVSHFWVCMNACKGLVKWLLLATSNGICTVNLGCESRHGLVLSLVQHSQQCQVDFSTQGVQNTSDFLILSLKGIPHTAYVHLLPPLCDHTLGQLRSVPLYCTYFGCSFCATQMLLGVAIHRFHTHPWVLDGNALRLVSLGLRCCEGNRKRPPWRRSMSRFLPCGWCTSGARSWRSPLKEPGAQRLKSRPSLACERHWRSSCGGHWGLQTACPGVI
mmetsp:Transcript_36499/g.83883  ORF Transcript_36499/g.83883 Transcript_36499/m.83883 type:complete len:250 (-) Transcript_36499:401-1150(-)